MRFSLLKIYLPILNVFFEQKPLTGLTLDIVASRDIAHNSEVFIDFSM